MGAAGIARMDDCNAPPLCTSHLCAFRKSPHHVQKSTYQYKALLIDEKATHVHEATVHKGKAPGELLKVNESMNGPPCLRSPS
eukprot:CAMPEP_0118956478 /NCGR_PEP_ID=MMETSP1169-20130426/61601_1 /TAXON_ID=36882 /ORGANISM="Pyramimonas obovata, Strain CCMP722" /LENGTH=82 /DNA_ID=CAMNT_0006904511 /DNA_START=679 /DNA_END=927 /DNA_ORIENTATION=+